MQKILKYIAAAFILALIFCPCALAAEVQDISADCQFWVSEGSAGNIKDDDIRSGWEPGGANAEIRIGFPEGSGYVAVEWKDDPTGYVFTQYDANQNPIGSVTEKESFVGISQLFELSSEACYASLQLTNANQAVQKVSVYSAGTLPNNIMNWKPAYEKCDLMVVSTHQDDEWIFFGGIIPYYQYVQDKDVQVVYMANCGRYRKNEALRGLWAGGVKNHPEFIDLVDERISSLSESLEHWGGKEKVTEILVERVRRFKPEVILTHDWDGEYGHNQHKLTARAMETVIQAAADPGQFPESYEKYGAWQVKKLYLHLAKESQIDFDWNKEYAELNGYTPLEVAKIGYSKHVSQHDYFQVKNGGEYDNSLFGLTYSVVGDDVQHNDLFENVIAAAVPSATPVPTPDPMPTLEPEMIAADSDMAEPNPASLEPTSAEPETAVGTGQNLDAEPPIASESGSSSGLVTGICVGIAAIAAGAGAFIMQRRNRRKRRRRKKVAKPVRK